MLGGILRLRSLAQPLGAASDEFKGPEQAQSGRNDNKDRARMDLGQVRERLSYNKGSKVSTTKLKGKREYHE